MHYKNGREAKVGDQVVGKAYNTTEIISGRLTYVKPDCKTCNCTIAYVGDAVQPVKVDYSQCDFLLHVEDAYRYAVDTITAVDSKTP